uniref:Uncharacterized protein n=1 Tax=Knipowitschia caucasica TaxID=637954 RepID=A0AAV2MFS5_KNICA
MLPFEKQDFHRPSAETECIMGCGLKKMKPVSGEQSPGKIYSTLKRPQVETRVGPAYTYRYLDFLIGKDAAVEMF